MYASYVVIGVAGQPTGKAFDSTFGTTKPCLSGTEKSVACLKRVPGAEDPEEIATIIAETGPRSEGFRQGGQETKARRFEPVPGKKQGDEWR
ncbi:hypothetical protein AVO41_03715 [Thiomicrospira sp. WB1]|nr:hypothetical protein AVO41_03715 [Thiomicrospira sp. WB1]